MPSLHEFCRDGNESTEIVSAENVDKESQLKYTENGGSKKDTNCTR